MTPRPKTLPQRVLEAFGDHQWHTLPELHQSIPGYAYGSVQATVHRLIAACHPIEKKFLGRSPNTFILIFAYRLKKPVDTKTGS